jgi:hypothetical protein
MRRLAGSRQALFLAVGALLLSAPLVFLVPPGEAPDEPAHVAYVHHLVSTGTLPPYQEEATGSSSYEFYQPPLAYAVMAAAVRASGFEGIEYPFTPDPGFAFQRGARAYRPPPASSAVVAARNALLVARSANLVWVLLLSAAVFLTCRQLTASPWIALAAGAPFALVPQGLFLSAMVGNDAAVAALAAAGTFGLVLVATKPSHPLVPVAASIAAGLALWAKASAVVLAPAVALTLLGLAAARRWRDAAALLLPGLALSVGWVLLEVARTGSALPDPPTGWEGGPGAARLFIEPWWVASAWVGFWAKLGWFNVPLPAPVYLVFVPPTLAAMLGLVARRRAGWLLAAIVAASLALLGLYMTRIDWQPQGRYLLPAAAAAAGLATIGVDRLCSSWSDGARKRLAFVSCALAVAAALAALAVAAVTYR